MSSSLFIIIKDQLQRRHSTSAVFVDVWRLSSASTACAACVAQPQEFSLQSIALCDTVYVCFCISVQLYSIYVEVSKHMQMQMHSFLLPFQFICVLLQHVCFCSVMWICYAHSSITGEKKKKKVSVGLAVYGSASVCMCVCVSVWFCISSVSTPRWCCVISNNCPDSPRERASKNLMCDKEKSD